VIYPTATAEVAEAVRLCARHRVPVIAYGAGTSVEGHVLAVEGGVTIDLSRMGAVIAVDGGDLTATVEAGVTRKQLDAAVRDAGLFFPVDPGADATLGGMAATRASGSGAVRYGTMRENVLGLRVVTAGGEVVRTAGRAKKSAAGYDLTRIFVGSEGTLGIITEVTVRLYPRPEAVSAAVCPFPDVAGAVDTVIRTIRCGVPVARAELLDALSVTAVNRYSRTKLREQPTLFLEFHGTPSGVREQAEAVQRVAREHGGQDFEWAADPGDRERLWAARHTAYLACLRLRPGARAFTTDACVPISRLAECIAATIEDTRGSPLPCPILGHVGDGNFHCIIVVDPTSPAEMAEAERLNQRVMRRALAMDGTCTGEHGVGLHKVPLLAEEFGDPAVDLMRRLKAAWDPLNILNPGKVVASP
jgi:D-lactate dehydrogenase (cytochrome)